MHRPLRKNNLPYLAAAKNALAGAALRVHGRIIAYGGISGYNDEKLSSGPSNLFNITTTQLTLLGMCGLTGNAQGTSGLELARHLRVDQPHLKVLFMSGYSTDIAGQEFQFQNGENFLQKSIATYNFLTTIRRCLDE